MVLTIRRHRQRIFQTATENIAGAAAATKRRINGSARSRPGRPYPTAAVDRQSRSAAYELFGIQPMSTGSQASRFRGGFGSKRRKTAVAPVEFDRGAPRSISGAERPVRFDYGLSVSVEPSCLIPSWRYWMPETRVKIPAIQTQNSKPLRGNLHKAQRMSAI